MSRAAAILEASAHASAAPAEAGLTSPRKGPGRASEAQGNGASLRRGFAKRSPRRTGPSVDYKRNIFGNSFTDEFIAEVEADYDRLAYRCDPRKIIRGISKRRGATEEAVAQILLIGKFQQYRTESREWRRGMERTRAVVSQASADVWKKVRTA